MSEYLREAWMSDQAKAPARRAAVAGGNPETARKAPIVDAETLALAARGDAEARNRLAQRVLPHLYRFCLYLTASEARALDLAQDTVIKALASLGSLREPARFDSWLFRIARNVLIDRTKSAEWKVESRSDELPDENASGASIYGWEVEIPQLDAILAVRETLRKLAPVDRAVLVLIDCQELTHEEAAESLGLSVAAVRSRIGRARQRFLELFDESYQEGGRSP